MPAGTSRREIHAMSPAIPDRTLKKSVALSGQPAGSTAICTVGVTGNDLHYRGYDILDIAQTCEFEEIAFLLIHGHLPIAAELDRRRADPLPGQAAVAARTARSGEEGAGGDPAVGPACPRRTSTPPPARATSPTSCWPASARCCSTGTTSRSTAGAST
jgi:hypothetical protein